MKSGGATYTVPEAAEILGISRASAYNAARGGLIPVVRISRRIVVPRAALERLLEGGEHGNEDEAGVGARN